MRYWSLNSADLVLCVFNIPQTRIQSSAHGRIPVLREKEGERNDQWEDWIKKNRR